MSRVVITGIGIVSPLGVGINHVWPRIMSGESGIVSTSCLSAKFQGRTKSQVVGLVPRGEAAGCFNPSDPLVNRKGMGTFIQYALLATQEALMDADWTNLNAEQKRVTGVSIGNGLGGLDIIEDKSIAFAGLASDMLALSTYGPFFIPSCLPSLAAGYVSMIFGLQGPNRSVNAACASGLYSIEDGAAMIRSGDAEVVVAGSTESTISMLGLGGFDAMTALSRKHNDQPSTASRPYDAARDGFVLSEGAGIVILESLEHAKKRGVKKMYAEYLGSGLTADAGHISAPSGEGSERAMRLALRRAGVVPEEIGYIGPHATSTPIGDKTEIGVIRNIFGDHLMNHDKIKLSAVKSSMGHLLAGASGLETVVLMASMLKQELPPSLNVFNPDECILGIDYVPHPYTKHNFDVAIKNSFGFGGTNASSIFRRI